MLPINHLKKIIKENKLLEPDILEAEIVIANNKKIPLEEYLLLEKKLVEKDLYEKAAKFYELPFISLEKLVIPPTLLARVPENIAIKYQLAVFEEKENELSIATCLPPDLQIIEFVQRKEKIKVNFFFSGPTDVSSVITQYRKDIGEELLKIDLKSKDTDVVDIIYGVVENAVKEGASDVHIEPKVNKTVVRYRTDGILREIISFPKEIHAGIVTRIKIISNLKVDEHRLPQDGRYNMVGPGYKVSLRVSIVHILEGEKVVLRILHQGETLLGLNDLGLQQEHLDIIESERQKKQGIVLVVGPTGSGKTTTLYTLLNDINEPGINISTIEDPIEYNFPEFNQSQVNPKIGYTFATGLRAFVRQDPDVIMVGEIRDQETAEIALRAALTGHLVFSTLHTNDASSSLPRLREMEIPPYMVGSTFRLIIAQRLIRKVCANCKEKVKVAKEEIESMEKFLTTGLKIFLSKYKIYKTPLYVYKGKGCDVCKGTGLKGRVGIYEILRATPEIRTAILQKVSAKEIHKIATSQGMMTLAEDGILKVFQGVTIFDEIIRIL